MNDESRKALIINYLQKRKTSIIYLELLINHLGFIFHAQLLSTF
jgi:hypothetical protein